ncbi:MAG: proline--tRNA ligase [Dehalococcoidia bacterium]|nr:proline--tRNA ligase [Dehalococcoidia bacterium]
MRLSRLFGKTQREVPAEAESTSHQLMLKAGMIYQVAAGVYAYLPLCWRVLRKIEQIVREEMDAAGGQELMMPVLQPLELWQESGRVEAFGDTLFRLEDRRERFLVLAPTHEEVVTELVKRNVKSYRDLPLMLYQIQTKFRDEPRPRGGLIRVREFTMKDLYSFDADADGLDLSYRKMLAAYHNIFRRCGLPSLAVEADSGAIGGKDSHEFMLVAETGENLILFCDQCDYAANVERAEFAKGHAGLEEQRAVEEIATPGVRTIEQLAKYLRSHERQTIKAVFYAADGQLVFVVIRGDLEVNDIKLKNTLKAKDLRLATPEEVDAAGLVAGSASPVGLVGFQIMADDSVTLGRNFAAGANKVDFHLLNVNYPRDFAVDTIADIASARAGDACSKCGGKLQATRGIEVGHTFKLGTAYSLKLGASFVDRDGGQKPIVMGCFGIGMGRILAGAIEQNHDDKGIIWPASISPYQVHLTALGMDNQVVADTAEILYADFERNGFEVLFDDRIETPGVKFNDADLLGLPLRVTVSPRTLKANSVEIKRRRDKDFKLVPVAEACGVVREMLATDLAATR